MKAWAWEHLWSADGSSGAVVLYPNYVLEPPVMLLKYTDAQAPPSAQGNQNLWRQDPAISIFQAPSADWKPLTHREELNSCRGQCLDFKS